MTKSDLLRLLGACAFSSLALAATVQAAEEPPPEDEEEFFVFDEEEGEPAPVINDPLACSNVGAHLARLGGRSTEAARQDA